VKRFALATALSLSLLVSTAHAVEPLGAPPATIGDLSWLAGCWDLLDADPGSEEVWLAPAGGVMLGVARTVRHGKTVAWEVLQIRETEPGRIVLIAKPHNQPEAVFDLAAREATAATFENAAHDFPQRILYRRDGDRLVGRIEGTEGNETKGFDFPMQRRDCEAAPLPRDGS
jgi:hypothetical protein